MSACAPRILWRLLFGVLLWPGLASAWVETAVRSHQARVVVARDGSAEVRHELVLKLRGGPLHSFDVSGISPSAELLGDATVSRADQGAGLLSPLELTMKEGQLELRVTDERGLRGGSYAFEFAYRISLHDLGWIQAVGDELSLSFVGPRLHTGVDAARVTFVVPRAAEPPHLAENPSGLAAGTLLHQVRRDADADEVELVRAHLASGEPALWQVLVARDALKNPTVAEPDEPAVAVPVVERSLHARTLPWGVLVSAALVAIGFGLLAFMKGRAAAQAAAVRGARTRALLPGAPAVRATIAGAAVGVSFVFALRHQPTPAALVACVALLATTYLLPVRIVVPRGPGEWKKLDPTAAPPAVALPGLLWDVGNWRGFGLFCAIWIVLFATAYRFVALSPYFALLAALSALLFVPLFWTGRHADYPEPPWLQGRRWFVFLNKKLDRRLGRLELWGRCPHTGLATNAADIPPDEVRVRILPTHTEPGLRALEVALEEAAGSWVMPCVVVRVLEDSPAAALLPQDLPWVRGLRPEEKVAIVRPPLPTPSQLLRLVRSLTRLLNRPIPPRGAGEKSVARADVGPGPTGPAHAASL